MVHPGKKAVSLLTQPPNAERCASEILSAAPRAQQGFASRAYAVLLLASSLLSFASACSKVATDDGQRSLVGVAGMLTVGAGGSSGATVGAAGLTSNGGAPMFNTTPDCPKLTCADLGWACGYTVDKCGNEIDCAKENLACSPNQVCIGGVDGPTKCVAGGNSSRPLWHRRRVRTDSHDL